ncbi:MAG TPA: hypothetical protein PKW21_14750 [Rhabdaerophilum sp.]|nr:hypothetical protein [Rhabdaerophilum sp.]
MSEKSEAETTKPARGKDKKTAPAIDLAPGDVKEIVEEARAESLPETDVASAPEATSEPSPVSPSSPPPIPKLVPGLIGLVAGVIGGLGAYQFGEALLPRKAPLPDTGIKTRLGALEQRLASAAGTPSAALIARLEKAESLLSETGKREEMLRGEIGKLGQALSAEVAERRKAVEAATARAGQALGLAGAPPASSAEIEGLKSRLGSVEDTAKALPEMVAALGTQLKAVGPRVDTVSKEIIALSSRLAQLGAQEKLGAAQARLAAVTLLEESFGTNRPLGEPVRLLKNLGVSEADLAAFTPYLETSAPDAARLLADLHAIKPKAESAEGNPGFFDRLKAGATSLVEIRKTGSVTGTDDASHIQRAELALQRGDIGTAAALIVRLSAANAPAYAEWRLRAEQRAKATEALVGQKKAALANLAAAAAK